MGKIMKPSSAIKTIVVILTADNISEFEIDTEIFDDPYMEALTRAVEKIKKSKGAIINAFAKCWEKKYPKKQQIYNAYWILINAGCYVQAELLREKFKVQNDVDLSKEPIHGKVKPNSQ